MNKEKDKYIKLYVPELQQLFEGGDEKTCLMMAQLEYWFGLNTKYIDGFYKFMNPPKEENRAYIKGDSWTEEMGMSASKIMNALKPICESYKKFTDYKKARDKFKGKLYCRYYHKPSHQTYYFRNHDLVNEKLAEFSMENKSSIFRAKQSSKLPKETIENSGNQETIFPEMIEAEVVYTENTTENNSKSKQREREELSHFKYQKNQNTVNEDTNFLGLEIDNSDYLDSENVDEPVWMQEQDKKIPFPTDFELTDDMKSWAEEKKPNIDVKNSTEKFKIYKRNFTSKDWLSEWQIWIINEKENISINSSTEPSLKEIYDDGLVWIKSLEEQNL